MAERKDSIQTYVLFDTESTGLPSPGNYPRITELCFLAITKDELLSRHQELRVLNKLHLCINPVKLISSKSSELTGLYNDSLSNQATFKQQASVITSFLKNLKPPVCIVAHNGHTFDFPLLQAHLKRSQQELSTDILCADTLQAFRTFDGLPPVPEFILQREKKRLLHSETESQRTQNQSSSMQQSKEKVETGDHVQNNDLEISKSCGKRLNANSIGPEEPTTKERKYESQQEHNETTPERKTSLSIQHNRHRHPYDNETNSIPDTKNVRKNLLTALDGCKDTLKTQNTDGQNMKRNTCDDLHDVSNDLQPHDSNSQQSIGDSDKNLLAAYDVYEDSLGKIEASENMSHSVKCKLKEEIRIESCVKTKDKLQGDNNEQTKSERGLESSNSKTLVSSIKKSYALGNLYNHFMGEFPQKAHTAEDDCKILLKLIQLNLEKFILYCDENALLFSEVKSMY